MISGFFTTVSFLALAALSFAEPIPAAALEPCPQATVTTTPACGGTYVCPIEKPCTATVTTTRNCGGPGPVCSPRPTPTITITANCTPPCKTCEFTSTATHCTVF